MKSLFLKESFYEAIFISKDMKAPSKDIVEKLELQVYTDDFGTCHGDKKGGLCATAVCFC